MPLSNVNFANLPTPKIVEPLDFNTILNGMVADLLLRDPTLSDVNIESSPMRKLLEVCAYRELIVRQRVNDGAHGVMLAYATGSDLDQIGANYGAVRLQLAPVDNTTLPPTPAVMEADDVYRERIRLSLYSRTTAGSVNQYKYFATSANADVLDVSITSPMAGDVVITVLSRTGAGVPTQAVLDAVMLACNADHIRPLTDHVMVQAAAMVNYTVAASLTLYPNGDPITIQAAALKSLAAYCDRHHALGNDITQAGLIAALTVVGVQNVALTSPAADIVVDHLHASYATSKTVSISGTAI